jgi:glutamyl-tRNA synthetase
VEFDTGLLGDIVIAKNLQLPLFHFAVVVDDFQMQISHVIRGEEHLSNTPRQILIQKALGFPQPTYGHLPLLLNPDRSKLSKRYGDIALADYHKQGYLPEALINFMVLLGWNPGTEKEVFSLSQLEKEFSIERVQKAGAIFNIQRLDFLNGLYIREKPIEKLTEFCLPYLIEANLLEIKNSQYITQAGQSISFSHLEKIVEVCKTRMKKLSEIRQLSDFFFKEKLDFAPDLLKWNNMSEKEVKEALLLCDEILSQLADNQWNIKKLEEALSNGAGEFNKKKGYPEKNKGFLLWPLRVALSGKESSPSPFEIADILGREETLKKIKKAIKLLS